MKKMRSIIAQVRKKWSRHNKKELAKKLNWKQLDKEFKANEWSDKNETKKWSNEIVKDDRKRLEKGYCKSSRGTVKVCLDLKPPISLYCRKCEPHYFQLNLDDEW